MLKKCFIILMVTLAQIGSAALSPTSQALVEVQKIFSSQEVETAFGGPNFITACIKTPEGYLIQSDDQQMQVKVIYEPNKKIGPQQFHLEFGQIGPIEPQN